MFDTLSSSLQSAWKSIGADGRLTKENIKAPLRDVRRALLEADVSLPVVRRFVARVEEAALGTAVAQGVTPQTQFVKCVNDELVRLMGGDEAVASSSSSTGATGGQTGVGGAVDLLPPKEKGGPQVVLLAGLQGVGKTTAAGKLAALLKRRGKKVLLVATDVYRPAAIDQLVRLGERVGVPVHEMGRDVPPADIAAAGVARAKAEGFDAVVVDTAGRLTVDAGMMAELRAAKERTNPSDVLLVVDAMTGQEAAALVKAFDDEVALTGAVLTKMDGDSRGGAALSVREVSGKPVKFVGTGEKMDALEPFYPERMAQRILGMGDVLTLYEKAQEAIKEDEAQAFADRLKANKFDFNDFLAQWKKVNSMGGLQMMKLLPGMSAVSEKQLYEAEKRMKSFEAMIGSMTTEEREAPELLLKSPSRRRRVAEGSGRTEEDVSDMLSQFAAMRVQVTNMGRMMKLSGGGASPEEQQRAMRDMLRQAQAPVAAGKVRRKREKGESGGGAAKAGGKNKGTGPSKGFAAQR